jgi:hypothetical protein
MKKLPFEMTEKLILKSDDFLDGQNHTFNFGSVEIERSINCLSVYADWHYLELFGNWEVVGIYENEQAETPKKLLIKAHTHGDVVAVVEVDLSRRLPVSTYVTETRQKFFAFSEMLAEGEKTMMFGHLKVKYTQNAIRVTDRYLQAELHGSWEIRSVFNKGKEGPCQIEINVYRGEKICSYLRLKI